MSGCDRYWREGVVLVEQGVTDLHRESCEACQEAHAARAALVAALPYVGAEVGMADWKARVWDEIDRSETRRQRRGWWIGGGFALAAAAALLVVLLRRDGGAPVPERYATAITIEKGPIKKRGGAQVGDRVRAVLDATDEVRVYRSNQLVFQCGATASVSADCARDERGRVGLYELPVVGNYTILIVTGTAPATEHDLDKDMAAFVKGNVTYRIEQELAVR